MTTCDLPTGRGVSLRFRHAAHLIPVTCLVAFVGFAAAMSVGVVNAPGILFVVLAMVVAAAVALPSWVVVVGTLVTLAGRSAAVRGLAPAMPAGQACTVVPRTAVLVPVYEEDPVAVFAAVAVMRRSLPANGIGDVDIFVLSDTRNPATALAEERQHAGLLARIARSDAQAPGSPSRAVHYRRRAANVRRKAGNIEDFCVRWGGTYDFMVVLDADSLMVGDAIARMIGLMEANPKAGIVQTMCYPVGRATLFARAEQFVARIYGPLLARGVSFWQGPHGAWWGHNAIIRTDAFMRHCGLPDLPGRAPLGGEILCHDTVEAALMVRAGWEVWLAPEVSGSFEQAPTNLVDNLSRDRRWCQGNMQHLKVLGANGLKLASGIHVGGGILHYLTAPLVVAFLVAAAVLGATSDPRDAAQTAWSSVALWTVVGLLFTPRLLGVAWTLADHGRRSSFGGTARVLAGAALEAVIYMLTVPVTLCCHVAFLWQTFTGRVVGWDAQSRDDRGVGWHEAIRRLGVPLAAGIVGCALLAASGGTWAWIAALPGLLLAVPLVVFTSMSALGLRAKAAGLFATPEETSPPVEFAWLAAERQLAACQDDVRGSAPNLPDECHGIMPRQQFWGAGHRWNVPMPGIAAEAD
jgi:membrane glycosyltransferase